VNKIGSFLSEFFWEIGVDLGSSRIRIFLKDKGLVIDESSLVARVKKKKNGVKRIVVFGQRAKEMINREPKQIEVVAPIKRGVVADLEVAVQVATNYLKMVYAVPSKFPRLLKPKVVVAVGSMISEVQKRAYKSVFLDAGAREVILVDSGLVGALGAGFGINESGGLLVADIGASKTEISLVSMGGIVIAKSLDVGGDDFDESIINYVRMKYGLLIGKNSAEKLKIEMGGVARGRDLESNLPKSIRLTALEIEESVALWLNKIVRRIKEILDEMPTEMTEDVLRRGIMMIGGGSQFKGLQKMIEEETKINAMVVSDASEAIVKGCGEVLINNEVFKRVRSISDV
jgi:rod shape-determining protein MreB